MQHNVSVYIVFSPPLYAKKFQTLVYTMYFLPCLGDRDPVLGWTTERSVRASFSLPSQCWTMIQLV